MRGGAGMKTTIQSIEPDELDTFLSILREAADWLRRRGRELWTPAQLTEGAILGQYGVDELFLCRVHGEPAGVMILAKEETIHWPDEQPGEAVYMHKLAVRRAYAGTVLSTRMIEYAKEYTRELGRAYLRLDCDYRPALCALYERNGFDRVGVYSWKNGLVVAYYQYRV